MQVNQRVITSLKRISQEHTLKEAALRKRTWVPVINFKERKILK